MANTNIVGKERSHIQLNWTPNKPLNENAMKYFDDLIASRASFDWQKSDIIMLTRLAGWLDAADGLQERVTLEGLIIHNDRGTPITNPVFGALDSLERRIMQAFTKLNIYQLSINATALPTVAKRLKNAQERQSAETDNDEELLS